MSIHWISHNRAFAYGIAIAASAAAVVLRILLDPYLTGVQFITFFPVIILASYLGGWRPGMFAASICGLAGWYLFLPPLYSLKTLTPAAEATLLFYFATAAAIAFFVGSVREAVLAEHRAAAALREEQARTQMLLNELNHRVKNSLAIVQAIARQTFKEEASPAARDAFEGRLAALSGAQNVLTASSWESAPLRQIVLDAVAFHPMQDRFEVEGPDCRLGAETALAVALTLHELLTNAMKHGALSGRSGRVDIRWTIQGTNVDLVWRETGGPPVSPPAHRGFGTRLIERSFVHGNGSGVHVDYRPEGLECVMRLHSLDPA